MSGPTVWGFSSDLDGSLLRTKHAYGNRDRLHVLWDFYWGFFLIFEVGFLLPLTWYDTGKTARRGKEKLL
jgi:hypothetical protein